MADFQTLSADGDSNTYTVRGVNGVYIFAKGNFGGGILKAQLEGYDSTFRDIPGLDWSGEFGEQFMIPHNAVIRFNLSGSTSPSIYLEVRSTRWS